VILLSDGCCFGKWESFEAMYALSTALGAEVSAFGI